MLAATYLIIALVALVSAVRAGSAGGGKQRLGMISAGIGFILLGVNGMFFAKDSPDRTVLLVGAVFLVAGVVLYWWGHLKN